MDYEEIRRTVIVAVFSDPLLFERLVVKGGNALRLVHGIGSRTSLDVDFSTPGELDERDTRLRLENALRDRFESAGLHLFDFDLRRRPEALRDPRMSGYEAEFKVIELEKARSFGTDRDRLRREAATTGPQQQRVFSIEISAYEFCEGAEELELDAFVVRAYSPAMIAVEKYRAICQQNPKYRARPNKTARARDFLDIHSIVTTRGIDLKSGSNRALFRAVFAAKDVPLQLLSEIGDQREFHRTDWPRVEQTVLSTAENPLRSFDFYFEFCLEQISDEL